MCNKIECAQLSSVGQAYFFHRDIDRYCTVYLGNVSVIFLSLLKTTMGLQRSVNQFIYLSILNIQILTDNVDCRSVQYCNVLNDVFFERRANITQSTIYLVSMLIAGSFPTPEFSHNTFLNTDLNVVFQNIQLQIENTQEISKTPCLTYFL